MLSANNSAYFEPKFHEMTKFDFGWLVLMSNGEYNLLGFLCDQETVFGDTILGKVKISKEKGTGKNLIFVNPDGTREVIKYENGKWYILEQTGITYQ